MASLDHRTKDDVKPIPRYQAEDAQWGYSKTYELIRKGHLEVVQILGRKYIKMASHRRLLSEGTK